MDRESLIARAAERIEIAADGCWLWMGSMRWNGYGQVGQAWPRRMAHTAIYELVVGPSLHDLDHLCRNRRCVNPDHLEEVTRSENLLRGAQSALQTRTTCAAGHKLTPENTYRRGVNGRGCRTCMRIYRANYKRRIRVST